MDKERILVTVKTYPTLSAKYGETVCTAGVKEDGSWIRLYPVPFRKLEEQEQYKKFDWIECRVAKHKDLRPESFRPVDPKDLRPVGHIDTADEWRERRRLLLETCTVHTNLRSLIAGAKENKMSLAIFKPARLLDFVCEPDEREWSDEKLQQMRAQEAQQGLFDDTAWKRTFKIIPKLPYKFSYQFEDEASQKSRMRILDWEIGALYWNCLRRTGNEQNALDLVKKKYWDEFIQKDLHFFLGTTLQFHQVAPNPWVIIGVFPIPHETQMGLL